MQDIKKTSNGIVRTKIPTKKHFLKENSYVIIGGFIILMFLILAIFSPLLSPMDPDQIDPAQRLSPVGTEGHILGTDHLGRDMLSRLIWGSRITIVAGMALL